jgi:hypothetical protein
MVPLVVALCIGHNLVCGVWQFFVRAKRGERQDSGDEQLQRG